MRVSADWLDDALNVAPEERATACDLRIWLGDVNVCDHRESLGNQIQDHVTISAYPLVERLAHDWWTIFGGRTESYRLLTHRTGYAIPDLRFYFDGAAFEVTAEAYRYKNPDVWFIAEANQVLDRGNAESVLENFIVETLDRLRDPTGASLRWKRVVRSRQDPLESLFCEAAGALGTDPYHINTDTEELIEEAGKRFEGEALLEFLAGANNPSLARRALQWIDHVEGLPRYKSRLRELKAVAAASVERAPQRPGDRSWAWGYRRARALRTQLGLDQVSRIKSVKTLAEQLGARSFASGPRAEGIRAAVGRGENDVHVYLRDRAKSPNGRSAQLFAFARAIGDAACYAGPERSVINDLRDAGRQAASRAFAAEFLAPVREVRSMSDDGHDVATIADEFSVSSEVIELQLENEPRIEQVCADL